MGQDSCKLPLFGSALTAPGIQFWVLQRDIDIFWESQQRAAETGGTGS